jgi:hypothetical protein
MWYRLNVSYLLAAKHVYHSELVTKAIVPIVMLAIVFGSYWLWPTYYIPIRAYLMTGVVGLLVTLYVLWREKYIAVRGPLFGWRRMMQVGGSMMVTGMAALIISYTDVLML